MMDITERHRAEKHIQELNRDLERRAQDLELTTEELRVTNEELHRANEKLHEANVGLQVANKELERLTESVALELRRPLVSLHHLAHLIDQDDALALLPQTEQLFQLMHANTEEMDRLTEGLLQVARIIQRPLQKQTVAPKTLVREVLQELEPDRQDRQVEITIGELGEGQADPALLKLVWSHLLSNALKFTRQHAYAQTIFRAFQRYHREDEYEGAGIWLAMVEWIIRRHGGRVWVEGEENNGAAFYFTFG
ncbi:MAG: hypothetical protein HY782_23790 [Chloroflexi bacterium]|nr:hypothetical protein [Chloroflexota bacterium]